MSWCTEEPCYDCIMDNEVDIKWERVTQCARQWVASKFTRWMMDEFVAECGMQLMRVRKGIAYFTVSDQQKFIKARLRYGF